MISITIEGTAAQVREEIQILLGRPALLNAAQGELSREVSAGSILSNWVESAPEVTAGEPVATKRTRRTKAGIEAENFAAAQSVPVAELPEQLQVAISEKIAAAVDDMSVEDHNDAAVQADAIALSPREQLIEAVRELGSDAMFIKARDVLASYGAKTIAALDEKHIPEAIEKIKALKVA